MKMKFRPVAMLENHIGSRFRLERKGRKLLEIGFALSGATISASLLQMLVLLSCGVDLHLWWRAMLPLVPIFVYASWRFFLRYLHPKAFACEWCRRMKTGRKQTWDENGNARNVCAQCQEKSGEFHEKLNGIQKALDSVREGLHLTKGE